MPIDPLQRVFYLQNRPCTPKIVGTFYMQGYKVKEKTAIVPHSAALYPQFQISVGTLTTLANLRLPNTYSSPFYLFSEPHQWSSRVR